MSTDEYGAMSAHGAKGAYRAIVQCSLMLMHAYEHYCSMIMSAQVLMAAYEYS